MTELEYNYPERGEANSSADGRIRTALVQLKETINGKLGSVNLESEAVTPAKLAASAFSTYRTILTVSGTLSGSTETKKYLLGSSLNSSSFSPATSGASLNTSGFFIPPSVIYFDDGDYLLEGKTLKLRLRAQIAANATAPAANFTVALYPVTVAGAAGNLAYTAGTVVANSAVSFTTPSASTMSQANSGDFTVPSDGAYVIAVNTSTSVSANNVSGVHAQLQTRNV